MDRQNEPDYDIAMLAALREGISKSSFDAFWRRYESKLLEKRTGELYELQNMMHEERIAYLRERDRAEKAWRKSVFHFCICVAFGALLAVLLLRI